MPLTPPPLTEPDYAAYITAYNAFMAPALASALAAFAAPPGSRGLDAGCGPGDLLGAFAEAVGPGGRVVGVDVSRPHLAVAAEAAAGWPQVEVVAEPVDLARPLPYGDGAFDWAWCADVLWPSSFADPAAVVGELARVVRPGGRVGLFSNQWSRHLFLPGHRPLEYALQVASDTRLRPPLGDGPGVDIEFLAGWLAAAGLADVGVTPHAVAYGTPLPAHARPHVEAVLGDDYLRALPLTDLDADARDAARALLTPGSPGFLPDQPHYFALKTGVLAVGTVPS